MPNPTQLTQGQNRPIPPGHPNRTTLTLSQMGSIGLLVLLAVACGEHAGPAGPDLPATELHVATVSGDLPATDPFAAAWDRAREVKVELLPQDVAAPRLVGTEKGELLLRGLTDGTRVAFRLVWEDDTVEDLLDSHRSSDAVAIQLPAAPLTPVPPNAMMGEEGKPVALVLWRAYRQRRHAGETVGVDALYPARTSDHYPPEAAKDPADRAVLERLYHPPVAVGNPVSVAAASPVEDLTAEGFGTLTSARPRSDGHGEHREGRWHVVISRPLDTEPNAPTGLRPGVSTHIAVAVWDGGKNQRGSRKMRSVWVPLVMEEAGP